MSVEIYYFLHKLSWYKSHPCTNNFSGDNLTYIYPDLRTALHGKFTNGKLVSAAEVAVVGHRCAGEMQELLLEKVQHQSGTTWTSESVNSSYIGSKPRVRDPLERSSVYVSRSTVGTPGLAGLTDGLFARRSFLPGQLIAYYSGVRGPIGLYHRPNMTRAEKESANAMMYGLAKVDRYYPLDYVMNIPDKYRRYADYRATLAHKANHDFDSNAYFKVVEHVVYGRIASLVALRYIRKHEEVFTNYNYNLEFAPRWYRRLYEMKYEKLPP